MLHVRSITDRPFSRFGRVPGFARVVGYVIAADVDWLAESRQDG